ncbi:MAG: UvrB/UvrC motif-containing protein, partial [Pseudomonadota bacterium]
TIGRAARNADGRVIMYADRTTGSMERALKETERRRTKQIAYNKEHGITPATVKKNVEDILAGLYKGDVDMNRVTAKVDTPMMGDNLQTHLDALRNDMRKAAEDLEFEEAARLRDEIKRLEAVELAVAADPMARQSEIREAVEKGQPVAGSREAKATVAGNKQRPGNAGNTPEEKLKSLIKRLGPDFDYDYDRNAKMLDTNYAKSLMPLVTLEEFYDGNVEFEGFDGAPRGAAGRDALMKIRDFPTVADIRLGISQWEGDGVWPHAEYLVIVTSMNRLSLQKRLKENGILFDRFSSRKLENAEQLMIPRGMSLLWSWYD